MELTFASAFSPGGLVGHFAYVLLVVSMLMRQMVWLRIFVVASALVALIYAILWLNDPVSTFWEAVLIVVNVVQLLITWRQNSKATFTEEELAFSETHLRGLARRDQRRLLSYGHWDDFPAGTVLTKEGAHPEFLSFIAEGAATVHVDGESVGTCTAGAYVGEMAYISGAPASADVILTEPSRLWRISRVALTKVDRDHPAWLSVLEAGIARDLRQKIIASNTTKAQSAPV